jgi:hypothetical protein
MRLYLKKMKKKHGLIVLHKLNTIFTAKNRERSKKLRYIDRTILPSEIHIGGPASCAIQWSAFVAQQ